MQWHEENVSERQCYNFCSTIPSGFGAASCVEQDIREQNKLDDTASVPKRWTIVRYSEHTWHAQRTKRRPAPKWWRGRVFLDSSRKSDPYDTKHMLQRPKREWIGKQENRCLLLCYTSIQTILPHPSLRPSFKHVQSVWVALEWDWSIHSQSWQRPHNNPL